MPRKRAEPPKPPALAPAAAPATPAWFDRGVADRIEDFIATHYEPRRPPVVAARLLAYLVALNGSGARKTPFPSRSEVAEALYCSKDGLDAAISVALLRHLITIEVKTVQSFGIVSGKREGVIRHRYYVPTRKLLDGIGYAQQAA